MPMPVNAHADHVGAPRRTRSISWRTSSIRACTRSTLLITGTIARSCPIAAYALATVALDPLEERRRSAFTCWLQAEQNLVVEISWRYPHNICYAFHLSHSMAFSTKENAELVLRLVTY